MNYLKDLVTNKFSLNINIKNKTKMITLLHNKVAIEKVEPEAKSAGGIILTGSALKPKNNEGVVVLVGEGSVDKDGNRTVMRTKVGDKVLFTTWDNIEIEHEGKTLLVIPESGVIAIL
jgi:chaperonin GroES